LIFFSPGILAQAHYPWTRMCALLFVVAALRARCAPGPHGRWIAGVAAGGALLSHQTAWMLLIPLAVSDGVNTLRGSFMPRFSRGAAAAAALLALAGGAWLFHAADGRPLHESDDTLQHAMAGDPGEWLRLRVAVASNSLVPHDAVSERTHSHTHRLSTLSVNGLTAITGIVGGVVAAAVVLRGRWRVVAIVAGTIATIAMLPIGVPPGDHYRARFAQPWWVPAMVLAIASAMLAACALALHERLRDRGVLLAFGVAIAVGLAVHAPMRIGSAHAALVIPLLLASIALAVRGGSRAWTAILIVEWSVLCVWFWIADRDSHHHASDPNWLIKHHGVGHAPLADPLVFPHDLGYLSPSWWLPVTGAGLAFVLYAVLRSRVIRVR
jgi:hypothetical protein